MISMRYLLFVWFLISPTTESWAEPIWFPTPLDLNKEGHIITEMPGTSEIQDIPEWADDDKYKSFYREKSADGNSGYAVSPNIGIDLQVGIRKVIGLGKTKVLNNGALEEPKDNQGFLVYDVDDFKLGLGVNVGAWTGLVYASIGATASIGRKKLIKRYVQNRKDIKSLKRRVKIPKNLELLNKYFPHDGDSLTYATMGGFRFMGAVGASVFWITAGVDINGVWKVEIERVDRKNVKVTITREKIIGAALSGGVPLSYGQLKWLKNNIKSFSFKFDLTNPKGLTHYQAFLKGDHKKVKEEIENKASKGIVELSKAKTIQKEKKLNAGFFIPLLFWTVYEKGRGTIFSETTLAQENILLDSKIGVFKRILISGSPFTNIELSSNTSFSASSGDKRSLKLFLGHYQKLTHLKKSNLSTERYGANLKLQITLWNATREYVKNRFLALIEWTGFKDELEKIRSPKNNLKFTEINLDFMLSNKAIKHLMDEAYKYTEVQWTDLAKVAINNYFRDKSDIYDYCPQKDPGGWAICKGITKRITKDHMKMAFHGLRSMKFHLLNNNMKAFSEQFAKFGQGFSLNSFTLKTIWWMMRGEPVFAQLDVKGSDIANYKKTIRTFTKK